MLDREKFFNGLNEFARFCDEQGIEVPSRCFAAATFSAGIIKKSVQDTYGDKSVLAPLQESTMELREDFDPSRPLLVDGSLLRDSFESRSEMVGDGAFGGVGSPEKLVLQHERGYVTASDSMIPDKIVPPRPAFTIGVYRSLPAVKELVYTLLTRSYRVFTGAGRFFSFTKPEAAMQNPGNIQDAIGDI